MYSNVVKERLLEESKEGPHTEIQLKKIVSTIPYTTKKRHSISYKSHPITRKILFVFFFFKFKKASHSLPRKKQIPIEALFRQMCRSAQFSAASVVLLALALTRNYTILNPM